MKRTRPLRAEEGSLELLTSTWIRYSSATHGLSVSFLHHCTTRSKPCLRTRWHTTAGSSTTVANFTPSTTPRLARIYMAGYQSASMLLKWRSKTRRSRTAASPATSAGALTQLRDRTVYCKRTSCDNATPREASRAAIRPSTGCPIS